MVPDKFNMVDMGGIDIIMMQGVEVPGLYNKLVESIAQCSYQCIYNWFFDGVLIPPIYVKMEVNENEEVVINEGVYVNDSDIIHIYSLEPPAPEPVIIPLLAEENGPYNVPVGVDGFNPVTVNVSRATVIYSNDGTLAAFFDQFNNRIVWYFIGFTKTADDVSIPSEMLIGQSGLLYSVAYGSDKETQIGQIGFYNNKIRSWTIDTSSTLAGTFWGVVYSNGGTAQNNPYSDPPNS